MVGGSVPSGEPTANTVTEAASEPIEVAQPRRGKGSGVKNLAAMRARSVSQRSDDASSIAAAAAAVAAAEEAGQLEKEEEKADEKEEETKKSSSS